MFNKPHYCPEWDFAFIKPGDVEMEACICDEGIRLEQGFRVMAKFNVGLGFAPLDKNRDNEQGTAR